MNGILRGFEWGLGREAAHKIMKPKTNRKQSARQPRYVQPKYNEWLTRTYETSDWHHSAKSSFEQEFKVLAQQGWEIFEFQGVRGPAMTSVKVEGKQINVIYGRYTPPSLQQQQQRHHK